MDIEFSPEVIDALQVFKEAVQLIKDQKVSRAYFILTAPDGSFNEAIQSTNAGTSQWLEGIRDSLLEPWN